MFTYVLQVYDIRLMNINQRFSFKWDSNPFPHEQYFSYIKTFTGVQSIIDIVSQY